VRHGRKAKERQPHNLLVVQGELIKFAMSVSFIPVRPLACEVPWEWNWGNFR
jgi:hypothetical protein